MVQWVHTVEDSEVGDFLHGGELIFSTGIANKNDDWLLPFVRTLIDKNVSGLVLNTGPYITSIPKEVIDYCNEMKLYDRENGTDYMGFLKMYLKCDGSVQRAAEETFVHRNTINYQLAKVKKVLGNEMKTFEDKLKLIIAFDIEDLI